MPEFARRFRECFPDLGASNRFLDPVLSAATMTPRLDPIALDDAIIAKHGEYEGSMRAQVAARYGPKAVTFVLDTM